LLLSSPSVSFAQSAKSKADSAKAARTHVADSMKAARAHVTDSLKMARQQKTDSIQAVRKFKSDSLASIRKYKNSKRYKDSVAAVRKGNGKSKGGNSLAEARQARMDSMTNARLRVTDSLALARRTRTDSIKAVQKHRTDSLASVKKYKTSKRYADSVSLARRIKSDSIKAVRTAFTDSISSVRKKTLDEAKASRKHVTDSMKTIRTKYMDSIKLVRKGRTDSLAKKKVEKDKMAKAKEKKKEDLTKLKLELKIKQKREAWSNKSMLKKKWTPLRSVAQNSFTHYNYYFNANRKMDEAELNMRRARRENYDSLIGLFPFDPNRDSSLLAADMDSIVHKASIGIQIHDPRVKWSNDLYLLLGKAYYYKGNYENAAIAFRYIIASDEEEKKKGASKTGVRPKGAPSIVEKDKHSLTSFLQHQSVHNDAILWLSRTYTTAGHVENAESILSLLTSEQKLPASLKGKLATERAFSYLAEGNHDAASEQLAITIKDKNLPDWLRQRAAFLNGQLLQQMEQHNEAANSFEQVLAFYPPIDMDFAARKNIAYNKLLAGSDMEDAMASLRRMLNDAKYATYYDQVYYVLGKLAVKAHKTGDAITYFTKSTTTPKAAKKQKALSFAALGDAYYTVANYPGAKAAYDSAAKYSGSVKDPSLIAAAQRSKVLSEISIPVKVIHDQDSLLELAAMSKREQQSVVRDYLRQLEKARQDSLTNAASGAPKEPEPEATEETANWYFANASQIQQGSTDFKRKWGNRPLSDNWRRASAVSFSGSTAASGATEEGGNETTVATKSGGTLTEEGLIARIPNTQAQKEAAVKTIQKAYINLAKAYVKQLDDYARAIHTLDTLDTRYPNHAEKEEELYLRYQIALKQNQLEKAQGYAKELLTRFPNSQYAGMLKPTNSESDPLAQRGNKAVTEYYDETYRLLIQHQYTEVLMRTNYAKTKYASNPLYVKRFEILEASANAGMGEYNTADTLISDFIRKNQGDTLIAWASTVQQYIKEVRNGGKPSWYKEGPLSSSSATSATSEAKEGAPAAPPKPTGPIRPANVPYAYSYSPDSVHYGILIIPGLDSRTSVLKKTIRSFDSSKYTAANLGIMLDLFDIPEVVLVVSQFANAEQAKAYMTALMSSGLLGAYTTDEIKPAIISAPNYRKMFYEKDTKPYVAFYGASYK
jgi:tetratricopeptide (TPR) repeat protein